MGDAKPSDLSVPGDRTAAKLLDINPVDLHRYCNAASPFRHAPSSHRGRPRTWTLPSLVLLKAYVGFTRAGIGAKQAGRMVDDVARQLPLALPAGFITIDGSHCVTFGFSVAQACEELSTAAAKLLADD